MPPCSSGKWHPPHRNRLCGAVRWPRRLRRLGGSLAIASPFCFVDMRDYFSINFIGVKWWRHFFMKNFYRGIAKRENGGIFNNAVSFVLDPVRQESCEPGQVGNQAALSSRPGRQGTLRQTARLFFSIRGTITSCGRGQVDGVSSSGSKVATAEVFRSGRAGAYYTHSEECDCQQPHW